MGATGAGRRVLFVQPSFQPDGGGNGVAAWMLEALRGRHTLGVISWVPLDVGEVNRFFGTSLAPKDVSVEPLPRWLEPASRVQSGGLALLRRALLLRAAAPVVPAYDVAVSASNEVDFGRPGIQYIHYPAGILDRPPEDARGWHRRRELLGAYYWLADRLAGCRRDGIRRNLTLTNSDWTGRLMSRHYGVETRTLYPPILAPEAEVDWSDRVNGFIAIGRIAPEKRLEVIVEIVSRVRARLGDCSLCIVGTRGPRDYYEQVRGLAARHSAWIRLVENVSRAELLEMLPRYRYGIHARLEEHFGMAPAEMAAAGCLVFVPRGGGQVEVVGHEPRLMYDDVDSAVQRIVDVASSEELQRALRSSLRARARLFSASRFVDQFRQIVETYPL